MRNDLKKTNKSRYDAYSVKGVPLCENVFTLKQYLLENCRGEIAPTSDTTFQIGYYTDGKKKYSISSEIQLAEVLSLAKNGIITLWVDPHKDSSRAPPGKKRKGIVYKCYKTIHVLPHLQAGFFHCLYRFLKLAKPNCSTVLSESEEDGDERSESSYNSCLCRLRKKYKLPEFKLRCWARMMVRKI